MPVSLSIQHSAISRAGSTLCTERRNGPVQGNFTTMTQRLICDAQRKGGKSKLHRYPSPAIKKLTVVKSLHINAYVLYF